ncbi:MAG: 50S ribosomal protein L35 [Verrucomicrobiae bacterium]|nr:50S ribosomal protein L35 [Verrucomicrobiae bacterium]
MQKTKKSIAKRFKVTGSGKVMRRSPNRRHLLSHKSVKQKRRSGNDQQVSPGFSAVVYKALPHSNRT